MQTSDRGRPVAFGHIGLHVSDIERSIRFYRDVIGLDEIERRVRDEGYLGTLTGYPGVRLDTCLLVDAASGIMLELLQRPDASRRARGAGDGPSRDGAHLLHRG